MNILNNYQKKLFPYAYNILGSVDDAFDVVQDVIVSFIESKRDDIKNEPAYLIKSVVNKSINLKKRNQKTVGDLAWLPDPIATENADHLINTKDIISYSMLVLLEHLNPKERAVFILKSAFDYSHQEIAEIFSISIDNSKQILSRAKKALKNLGQDFSPKVNSVNGMLAKYVDVIKSGNVKELEEMLSENVTTHGGGGAKVGKVEKFPTGVHAVALLLVHTYKQYLKKFRIEFKLINHLPAALFYSGTRLVGCQIFDIKAGTNKITNIYFVAGREKLKGI